MMINTNKIQLFSIITSLCLSIFLLHSISAATVYSTSPYVPSDHILLNCGSSSVGTDTIGRIWAGDVGSKFAPSSQNTMVSEASTQDSSISQIPYMTARIFQSQFNYTFPVSVGPKFVRLYFYPTSYGNFSASNALFSVSTGNYTLLDNFNSSATPMALGSSLLREFAVDADTGFLKLIFTPNSRFSDAYAFVNGIEILSMPDIFIQGEAILVGMGMPLRVTIENNMAIETVFRLNVGGNDISPLDDSGLYRSWSNDDDYTSNGVTFSRDPDITIEYKDVPVYIAPENVYSTARSMGPIGEVNRISNLTWTFTVDSGFYYLVRLHFCGIQSNASALGARVFFIYINEQTATDEADVFAWGNGNGIPLYMDYLVRLMDGNVFQDLSIALHPNIAKKPIYDDAFLNGVEIFKLSDSDKNLAGLKPVFSPIPTNDSNNENHSPISINDSNKENKRQIPLIVGGVVGFLFICFLPLAVVQCRRQGIGPSVNQVLPPSLISSLPLNLCRHFSFTEIKAATNDFDEALLLGTGGFGNVYKGEIDGGTIKVAIKRGNLLSGQGLREFQTEITMLSKLVHRHLVSLIGYCRENSEMILVYDYMARGTLREHIYGTRNPPLSWKQRLEICIGTARGLHYLHAGTKHTIIHRDIKTTNILLDKKWVAKVSDFGLSKAGPALDNTHVSTMVKGSFGYLDPEYFRSQQLNEKSDVYSFGVVLFEILCARPVLNHALPIEQVSLAEWALNCQKKGVLDEIIDPHLRGKIALESFKKFAETAEKCLAVRGIERPGMGDVLWSLELALQLQEATEMETGFIPGTYNEESSFATADVFSEIMNPNGR